MDISELIKAGTFPRSYRKNTTPASINPALAYAMNQIAGLDEKDRILDPCCGTGTILIERQLLKPALCIGVDIDPRQLESAKQNEKEAELEGNISLIHGDISEKKFSEGYFTKIISNLPYGLHSGSREKNIKLYHFLADHAPTWLKKGGKMVFLTSSKKLIKNSFEFNKSLTLDLEFEIPDDSLHRAIFVFTHK